MAEGIEKVTDEQISHLYDPTRFYALSINSAKDLSQLRKRIEVFSLLAQDAIECVNSIHFNFDEFKNGTKKEKAGTFAGEKWAEKYGPILMPYLLLLVSVLAAKYHVPWGTIYRRLRNVGRITVENNIAIYH